ncbi:hypothetical protein ABPG75_009384 [Micractinium tetrahymenae]
MEGPTVLLVATSSPEGNITAWDLRTGTSLTSFKSCSCPPGGLSRLGRDYLVAAQLGRGGGLHFWAWHKDHPHLRSFAAEQLTCVAASPDGAWCAAGGASGAAFVWETSSGRLLKTWPAHYKAITCLAWSDSGAVLVTGGEDTMVNAWLLADVLDATAGQQLQMGGPLLQPLQSWSDHTLPVTCLAVGAGDAGAIIASGSLDRTVKVRSLVAAPAAVGGGGPGAGPLLRSVPLPAAVRSLALDPGEHALYAGCASGAIYEVPLVGAAAAAAAAGLGSDAAAAAAVAGGGGGGGSGGMHALEGHSQAVTSLSLTPDAAYLVSGSEDASVRVWELRSRQQVRLLQNAARGPVSAVLVLPQPPHMLVGGSHAASAGAGAGGSGKRGPKRPQPLAPFSKYPNAPGPLQPWEGGLVLLDGTAAAASVVAPADWPAAALLGGPSAALAGGDLPDALAPPSSTAAAAASGSAAAAAGGVAAAAGGVAAAAGGAADAAALREENARLREQLDRALATAQQWGHLNAQLQQLCAERLLAANVVGPAQGARGVPTAPQRPSQPPTERQIAGACSTLDVAAAELAAAPFWAHLQQQLGSLPPQCAASCLQRMVIYGLGSLEQPGAVHIRYQLAAARLLAALLPLAAPAIAFDPVFSALDKVVLAHCSIQVIPRNERGRRIAAAPTLFFMPHCEAALTDALLAANLAAGTLHNVVVLGNRFSGYQASWALRHHARQQQQPQQHQQQHQQQQQHQHQQHQQQHQQPPQQQPPTGRGPLLQEQGTGAGGGHGGGGAAGSTGGGGGGGGERPDTMLRLCDCGAVRELAISERGFPVASAFNDLGLHWFLPDWRDRLMAD